MRFCGEYTIPIPTVIVAVLLMRFRQRTQLLPKRIRLPFSLWDSDLGMLVGLHPFEVAVLLMRFEDELRFFIVENRPMLPFSLWDSYQEKKRSASLIYSLPFSLWDSHADFGITIVAMNSVAVLLMRFPFKIAPVVMTIWSSCRSPYEILKDKKNNSIITYQKLPFSLWDSQMW